MATPANRALTLRRCLAPVLLVLALPAAADIDLSILRAGTDGAPAAATGNSAGATAGQPVVVPTTAASMTHAHRPTKSLLFLAMSASPCPVERDHRVGRLRVSLRAAVR